ncbi:hypothetical protein PRVXH_000340 [Proteinivorax hydrogeniformans]|uniref:DUF4825 domain-containing protein n=1 Tax=Proteinivorax hydrogeniformans TaxID=1826727 RepID=A0AAU8HUI5_9FIRM
MVKIKKGFMVLALCSALLIGLVGCEKNGDEKIVFDFDTHDVKQLEVFRYSDTSDAEKFVIADKEKIDHVLLTITSLDYKVNNKVAPEGVQVTSFRFHLADNSYVDVIYADIGVKDGIIKSPKLFNYKTQADLGGVGLDLIEGVPAEKVSEDELPYYE